MLLSVRIIHTILTHISTFQGDKVNIRTCYIFPPDAHNLEDDKILNFMT